MTKLPGTPLNELMDLSEQDQLYMRGWHNWVQRMYFYLNSGLNILNQFRNLGFLLFGLFVALKLDGPMGVAITGAIGIVAALLLVALGRYNVHHLSKSGEWLNLRFSTYFGIKAFNYQEQQTELLREIRDMLKMQRDNEQGAKQSK